MLKKIINESMCIGPLNDASERLEHALEAYLKSKLDEYEVKALGKPGTIGVHKYEGAKEFLDLILD